MSKFFTVVTATDKSMDGKSYYSGQAKTEQKSIDNALRNYKLGKYCKKFRHIRLPLK